MTYFYFVMQKLLLLLILFPFVGSAQSSYLVYLTDKQHSNYVEFSERSKQRREKNAVHLNEMDLEVSPYYLNELKIQGEIRGTSRWMNAVYYKSSLSESEIKSNFPFIKQVVSFEFEPTKIRKDVFETHTPKSIDYSAADTQIRQIGIDCLHDEGFRGSGVYFAVIDAGFKGMDTISYFDSTYLNGRVLDTYDFVNEIGVYDYSSHGTAVSSCIFGFGQTMGSANYSGGAPDVDVALYVSEDVFSETLIEEFYLVQALERCDVQGVDIANISLGYTTFDDPLEDHSYNDLDGNTTIAAQGVNTAVSKGIIVVAAAGNSGPGTISTPCDADSCLCAGAVNNTGDYAPFSSVGPNADLQVKPDVAATGWDTWIINDAGDLVTANGTSFASPMLAGGVACLINAHPNMTAMEIITAVRESGHQFNTPDIYLGFGIADLCVALTELNQQSASLNELELSFQIYPNPTNDFLVIELNGENIMNQKLEILDMAGRVLHTQEIDAPQTKISVSTLSRGVYQLRVGGEAMNWVKM
jgi:serine protease AprX